ncbi:MAG: ABC transporter ATP-binding protein [Desulfocapsaceae bacterium]|nr:ABC transporter ATP-binding protein [Desulfocapsaceae bacterium]
MLYAQNLNKFFNNGGEKIQVLRNVSLEIEEGEFLSIVGRSGSGKTTLLNVLSTLVHPDEGKLYYHKNDLASASAEHLNTLRQKDFAIIFQFHHLLPYLTVMQNTLLPFMSSFAPVPRDIVARAEHCLDRIGLADKKDRLPGKLSGGEQQRVAIARAMVKSARVLFADEPTGSLDQKTGEEIIHLLEELHKDGLTVVMVTHEPLYAKRAERILEMANGEIVS